MIIYKFVLKSAKLIMMTFFPDTKMGWFCMKTLVCYQPHFAYQNQIFKRGRLTGTSGFNVTDLIRIAISLLGSTGQFIYEIG